MTGEGRRCIYEIRDRIKQLEDYQDVNHRRLMAIEKSIPGDLRERFASLEAGIKRLENSLHFGRGAWKAILIHASIGAFIITVIIAIGVAIWGQK